MKMNLGGTNLFEEADTGENLLDTVSYVHNILMIHYINSPSQCSKDIL